MSFAWPWLALLAPLLWLLPKKKNNPSSGALNHPYLMSLSQQTELSTGSKNRAALLLHLIWLFLVIALMRPQWIGEPIPNKHAGRSIFLSVDLSESMLKQDMQWNNRSIERYQAVQAVVGEFVEKRNKDFIGLVVFGSFAEIQSPLTPDTLAVRDIINDLRPGMAGGSTAIGDGLALAVKQLRESESEDKVIILLSDGENRTGDVTPEQATEIAIQSGIKVYTIGFAGTQRSSVFNLMGGGSEVDERTLKEIADKTEGNYYRAKSTKDLKDVFDHISKLETTEREEREVRMIKEFYWLPLLLSLLLMIISVALPHVKGGKQYDAA